MIKRKKGKKKAAGGINSMTGFGRGEEQSPYGKITVEIKTLNHKNLSVTCNPFNGFFLLEEKIKKIFQGKLYRGKVFVRVMRSGTPGSRDLQKVEVREKVAKEYLNKINKTKKSLKIGGEVQIADLLALPGVVEVAQDRKEDVLWAPIKKAAQKALINLLDYRSSEGARLAKDFKKRLESIKKEIKGVKKFDKQSVVEYRKKLIKSIRDLAGSVEMDKGRVETEVALFAKNCDIAEEITRLEGHLTAYKETMRKVKIDAGKKLDFIAQEMQREVNTIGAKANDFRISKAVINMKSEIEKIREQVKNVE
ncbi:MAG: YicC/YloC family endoribonuclease [Candidatus Tantalella remota]|nr:YicC/YloC family endoribonuclease [Candidatus Tantalella remota]